MANFLQGSNGFKLTWRKGSTISKNGDNVDCLHLILKDENSNVLAKATLNANQIISFCLNNNKM